MIVKGSLANLGSVRVLAFDVLMLDGLDLVGSRAYIGHPPPRVFLRRE